MPTIAPRGHSAAVSHPGRKGSSRPVDNSVASLRERLPRPSVTAMMAQLKPDSAYKPSKLEHIAVMLRQKQVRDAYRNATVQWCIAFLIVRAPCRPCRPALAVALVDWYPCALSAGGEFHHQHHREAGRPKGHAIARTVEAV